MGKVIGGEFDFLKPECGGKRNGLVDGCSIYASGRAALWQILNLLKQNGKANHVYLPDYLCDSIYKVCEALDMPYSFYKIDDNLRADRIDLKTRYETSGGGILVFINYFGIVNCEEEIIWAKQNLKDVVVVLDLVQAPFEINTKSDADFAFTSLRKAFPLPDGGVVRSQNYQLPIVTEPNRFSQYKIAASFLKNLREDGYYDDSLYLDLYGKGEAMMDEDYQTAASCYTTKNIAALDIEYFAQRRRENASYLIRGLSQIGIKPCVAVSPEAVPLFIPVLLDNRDKVRKALFRNQIFTPVHWPIAGHEKELKCGCFMAEHELSLIVDHRYTIEDMERMISIIEENR